MSLNVTMNPAKQAPQVTPLIVCACHTQTGNRVCARLTRFDVVGGVASLVFHPIPPGRPIPVQLTNILKQDVNRDVIQLGYWVREVATLKPNRAVKQVFINF